VVVLESELEASVLLVAAVKEETAAARAAVEQQKQQQEQEIAALAKATQTQTQMRKLRRWGCCGRGFRSWRLLLLLVLPVVLRQQQ